MVNAFAGQSSAEMKLKVVQRLHCITRLSLALVRLLAGMLITHQNWALSEKICNVRESKNVTDCYMCVCIYIAYIYIYKLLCASFFSVGHISNFRHQAEAKLC